MTIPMFPAGPAPSSSGGASADAARDYVLAMANTWTAQNIFAAGTITADAPLTLTQTWNNGAVTFTGLKANVTDTASASGSLLLDLQVGGSSKFKVSKTSQLLLGGAAGDTAFTDGVYAPNWLSLGGTSNTTQVQMRSGVFVFRSDVLVSWSNDTSFSTQDLFLTRKAAASLRLGAADAASPVAQTLGVQSVVAGTTDTAGANFTIAGSQGTGTGAGGSIIFQVAPAGGSGSAQNALVDALTIDSTRNIIVAGNIFNTDGISGLQPNFANTSYIDFPTNGLIGRANAAAYVRSFKFSNGGSLELGPITAYVALIPEAANTLALRNSTNAQTLRVYGTYTDASNYERIDVSGGANPGLRYQAAGTGAIRNFVIGNATFANVEFETNGSSRWRIVDAGHFVAAADNTYDIGASGATRPRDLFVGGGMTTGAPTGGTAAKWKLGTVATVSPTSPNRTIEVDIGGTIYYIHAKTTND